MKRKMRAIIGSMLMLTMLAGTFTTYAEELPEAPTDEFVTVENIDKVDLSLPDEEGADLSSLIRDIPALEVQTGNEAPETFNVLKKRDSALPNDPKAKVTGSLTEENSSEVHLFSLTEDKVVALKLTSPNETYVAWLFTVDYETGTVEPQEVIIPSSQTSASNPTYMLFPAGDYAFMILSSDDNVGDSYTFQINATNSSENLDGILLCTEKEFNLLVVTLDGGLYYDGKYTFNMNNVDQLSWNRDEDLTWSGGYRHRSHKVYNVQFGGIKTPCTWRATSASSDNAILIVCDVGTGFSYMQSYYQSGSSHEMSFVDTHGKRTPRNLDEDDLANGNQHILVFDVNTGKVIDFYSTLNIYYLSGGESASWTFH